MQGALIRKPLRRFTCLHVFKNLVTVKAVTAFHLPVLSGLRRSLKEVRGGATRGHGRELEEVLMRQVQVSRAVFVSGLYYTGDARRDLEHSRVEANRTRFDEQTLILADRRLSAEQYARRMS